MSITHITKRVKRTVGFEMSWMVTVDGNKSRMIPKCCVLGLAGLEEVSDGGLHH